MNISRITFTPNFLGKTINIPYSYQAKHFHISDDDILEKEYLEQDVFVSNHNTKADFFRDDELYDPNIDYMNYGYTSYGNEDVPLFRQQKNPIDINYRNTFKTDRSSDSILDTDLDPVCYQIDPETLALNNEIEEFLEDNNNLKVFNELKRKRPNSEAEIMAVCKACTLKNKSNETNIDLNMIRKAFSLINKSVGSTDIHEVIRTLKSSVLIDNDGNQYYSPKLFNFAKDFPKHYMSVITVNKNKSEVFDSVSAKEFQKLYDLYGDEDLAAEIINACKLSDNNGNKILNSDLLYALSHLQNMKKVSQCHIPDIINLLKSHKRNKVEEFIVLQKLRYVINSTDKSGEQLLYKLEKR